MRSRNPGSTQRSQLLASRAQQMRVAPTASERTLWAALSGKRLGVAFRRQAVVGEYIVDFLAPKARLVVEVDGPYHADRAQADARRDRRLARLGYRVLRIEAELVVRNTSEAVQLVVEALR